MRVFLFAAFAAVVVFCSGGVTEGATVVLSSADLVVEDSGGSTTTPFELGASPAFPSQIQHLDTVLMDNSFTASGVRGTTTTLKGVFQYSVAPDDTSGGTIYFDIDIVRSGGGPFTLLTSSMRVTDLASGEVLSENGSGVIATNERLSILGPFTAGHTYEFYYEISSRSQNYDTPDANVSALITASFVPTPTAALGGLALFGLVGASRRRTLA